MIILFHQIIIPLLIPILALSAYSQNNSSSSGCDQLCGEESVPYPFGFSDGCRIKLNCSSDSRNIRIGDFNVRNVTSDQILVNLPAKCNRSVEELSLLFGANFAPTWRNGLLLENCSEPINDCVIPSRFVKSRIDIDDCKYGSRNTDHYNFSCYSSGLDDGADFLNYREVRSKGNCSVLLSSIMVDLGFAENASRMNGSSSLALDFEAMELGWWADGECDCDPNANCTQVVYEGRPGFRCKCNKGYTGDGFTGGEGCWKGQLVCFNVLNSI